MECLPHGLALLWQSAVTDRGSVFAHGEPVDPPTTIYVAAGIVRWVRGEEYGVETLVMDDESREDVEQYICQRVEDKLVTSMHGEQLDRAIKKWTEISEWQSERAEELYYSWDVVDPRR